MNNKKINLYFTVVILFSSSSSFAVGAEGFMEIDPYPPNSKRFSCANYSRDEWKVSIENEKLQISTANHKSSVNLELGGGKMTAENKGEFGGGLTFYGKKSQKIFAENISFLFPLPEMNVVAIGGVAHMGIDEGHLLVVGRPSETADWKIQKHITLPGNPYAVAIKDEKSFFFITDDGLYSIEWKTGRIEKLKTIAVGGLYPNSMVVVKNGHLYVGMRYAVAHFIPEKNGYKVKWLVKKRCSGIKAIDGLPE